MGESVFCLCKFSIDQNLLQYKKLAALFNPYFTVEETEAWNGEKTHLRACAT